MAKKKKKKPQKRNRKESRLDKKGFFDQFSLKQETKRHILGVVFLLLAVIFTLSFFQKAGIAGRLIYDVFNFLVGKAIFIVPLLFTMGGVAFFISQYKNIFVPLLLSSLLFLLGLSGFLEGLVSKEMIEPATPGEKIGGWLGFLFSWPFLRFFGFWVSQIILASLLLVSGLILWRLLRQPSSQRERGMQEERKKPSLVSRIFAPSFKVNNVAETSSVPRAVKEESVEVTKKPSLKVKSQKITSFSRFTDYKKPPLDLLDKPKGKPSAGDIQTNSAVIKKTLGSFDIPVEMSGFNVGPTVTQYSLKPADGIKLSKITSLSNDLALALATHPIRIEAPIPGKSLVGIEVPNKIRSFVRLKELMQDPEFQESSTDLLFALGKDVSGRPIYDNLGKMPHLLVAGSTGSGKTIFLNTLILSLIYRNSPDTMKFLLIDPKRVEFTVYRDLPHLICPPIVDAPRAVNSLKWLIDEMERRFKLLAEAKSRNINSYNEKVSNEQVDSDEYLPYIVLVVDELADLMAAKGRDVEASIVRLAQMARAVGIHLVLATQRPSVEVITGLIKANITSRVTFQVASQVDSRTILDSSGAEKLLGAGDMLFLSNELLKPKRVQACYISEKEVKKVVQWIKEENGYSGEEISPEAEALRDRLEEALEKDLGAAELEMEEGSSEQDPLYEKAKEMVVRYQRGSASLLQRKLSVGYARAARLIDSLEKQGVVGPSRGAKPRKVFLTEAGSLSPEDPEGDDFGEEDDPAAGGDDSWQKV